MSVRAHIVRHGKGPWPVAFPLVLNKWLASVHYVVVLLVFYVLIHWDSNGVDDVLYLICFISLLMGCHCYLMVSDVWYLCTKNRSALFLMSGIFARKKRNTYSIEVRPNSE